MSECLPFWRSLLFIPANNEKFVAKAHTRGADAIILDLEDSIAPEQKDSARNGLAAAVRVIANNQTDVVVRINSDTIEADVLAACLSDVSALIIPKVSSAESLINVDAMLSRCEEKSGLTSGSIRLIGQIEDVRALDKLDEIAQSVPRLMALSLGSEDFSTSAHMSPTRETLYWPNLQVAFACRKAGILPLGFPDSITLIEDKEAMEAAAKLAVDMGMVGAFCIHPKQVEILNRAMTPSEQTITEAEHLVEEFEKSQRSGTGVFVMNGKMVDLPVVQRAKNVLAIAQRIAASVQQY